MRRLPGVLLLLTVFLLLPSLASAQATLAGTVRDTSGAVLPGVTVEASSPVLIERARTVVSDGSGQYRITELPPGTYQLSFTLSGFAPIKREGLTVSGSGVIAVNAEMRVGSVQETVTVTGDAPLVDTQSVRNETVIKADTLSTLPATRGYGSVIAAVPALTIGGVAGAGATSSLNTPDMVFFTAHGGDSGEGRILTNGLTLAAPFGGGGTSTLTYDTSNAAEMQVLISGGLGEAETGGPSINMVPKSGGNTFSGTAFYSTSGDWAASNNVDAALKAVGISNPPTLRKNWDVSGALGGPIVKDRLWFYGNGREWSNADVRDGVIANKYAGDPAHWDYAPDTSIEARNADSRKIYSIRLTGQATVKNRVTFYQEHQRRCSGSALTTSADACRTAGSDWIAEGRQFGPSIGTPESWPGYHDFPYNVTQATWSSPVNGRTLVEAGFSRFHYGYARFGMAPPDGLTNMIPVTELTGIYGRPNLTYRGIFDPLDFAWNNNNATPYNWRAAVSYVTGAHNMKIGYTGAYFQSYNGRIANSTQLRYTFRDQVPVSVSYYLTPQWDQTDRTSTAGVYAQDQWTRGRLTLQGGIRYDRARSWAPAEGNGTTLTSPFNPNPISFPRTVSVSGYNDITPRMGLAYDVFGNGKTAVKVNLGKYVQAATADGIYTANNPASHIVTKIGVGGPARSWTDVNHNYVVDCNLLSGAPQNNSASGGDVCGPLVGSNVNFGNDNPNTTTVNPAILSGWNVRPHDWQFGVSVQQQVAPRVAIEAAYNRRWWGNFFVTDNTLTTAADYETFDLTIPQHDNLPNGGGTATYYAITQAAALRGAQFYETGAGDFGKDTAYWQGVDVTANVRLTQGLTVQAGTSTGRGVRDNCDVTAKLPELILGTSTAGAARVDSCHVAEAWVTSFRGLASYTVPKIDVLISSSFRSLVTQPGTGVGTSGASLSANYQVPNTVIQQALGRLPAGASSTQLTTANLLNPGELFTIARMNLVDMRFAKILRFNGRRVDIGMDLYNIFNSNVAVAYQQTYEYRTNGDSWLTPTSIAAPRLARFTVTLNF